MEHGKALGIKTVMVLPIMWIVLLWFSEAGFWGTTILGLILVGLAYAIGDMGILPRSSNMAATVSDFFLSLITIWIGLSIMGVEDAFMPSLIASAIIAGGEYFYHKWLIENEFTGRGENGRLSENH